MTRVPLFIQQQRAEDEQKRIAAAAKVKISSKERRNNKRLRAFLRQKELLGFLYFDLRCRGFPYTVYIGKLSEVPVPPYTYNVKDTTKFKNLEWNSKENNLSWTS